MSKTISKDTITRLIKDVKQMMKNPLKDNGIYYIHDDTDMLKGYALIIGPEDTPYFGGNYFFQFDYPIDYPYSPPKVTYLTNGRNIRFNPNLYKCGKVCVSILNTWHGEQWSACQTISTILLTLCTLLCKDPLLNEPGINKLHFDFKKYTEIVEYANLEIAVCDILEKTLGVYLPKPMDLFQNEVKEHFLKNKDRLLEFAEKKAKESVFTEPIITGLYSLRVNVDYRLTLTRISKLVG
jgi:ubiquitin-protein ligase